MSKTLLSLVFLAAAPLAAVAQATKDDIKKLATAGVSEDVIVAYVRSNGVPKLTADELIELKNAGVGEKVLTALASPSAPAAQPSQPATRTEVIEQPVYRTQYVYTPSVSSYWCSSHYAYDACRPSYYYPSYYYPTYTYARPYYSSYYSGYCGPRSYGSYGYWGGYPRVSVGFGFGWGGRRCR